MEKYKRWRLGCLLENSRSLYITELAEMLNHDKCSHPWTVHTSRLLMSKNSIKNVLENLFWMFGRGKTQKPSILLHICFEGKMVLSLTRPNFLTAWGDHLNSVRDLAVKPSPPPPQTLCIKKHNLQILAIT